MTPLFRFLFDALDARLRLRKPGRAVVNKVFPKHWSFLLGEVAMFSFAILVATGLFLTMFYRPSAEPLLYTGAAQLYEGRTLPAAYASIVELSHDVRGGLLFRRMHRGAAYLFMFATVAHLLRILLTGAFRRPREVNTHIGTMMLILVIALAYTGQNLVYDLLAGSSLRIAYATLASVPLIGDWLVVWVFGGEFPSEVVSRFFVLHILILPGLLTGLLVLHLALVARQRHTQFPRAGVDGQRYVVGEPLWPSQFAASTTLVLAVGGLVAAFSVLVPWSDVDLHGPLRLGQASNAGHAEWWLFWLQGAITIFPAFEWEVLGMTISHMLAFNVVLPGALFGLLFAYPFLERRLAGYDPDLDNHVCSRPLDVPVRAAIVLGVTAFVGMLTLAMTNDIVARGLRVSVESVMWFFRIAVLAVPAVVAWAAYARSRSVLRRRRAPGAAAGSGGDAPGGAAPANPKVSA
ncbi:MAG TPA: cytochrome b N-terminal domain-containing protein [Egibacteraceae bacterium]|nr:cytochrome b N-terminal domain-containing protein [Egibacteraceae bacterium]